MAHDTRQLIVRIDEQYADAEAVEELTTGLRTELRSLDAEAERLGGGEAPPGSRAIEWVAVGTLVVTLAQSDVLAAIINAVTQWAGRNLRRTVRIELDGDVLEMTGHGSQEQQRLTDAWLASKQAPQPAPASNRHALIVAGYEFQDPGLRRLRAPAHDAQALSSVLSSPAIGDFQVQALLNEPAPVINEAIEEFFADRKPDDLLLLHFSGHGVKDEEGELYFATAATKLNRLGATAISADFVNKRMNRSRSRRIVLLLDCCYAGAFGRGMVPRAGKQMDIQGHFGGRGRAVITASNASEYAFEGADLADSDPTPSVFTSALVDGLRTGDADMDQDGFVGLDELYEYVYDRVRRTTPNQTPGKWTFDLQGDLRIAKRGKPVTKPAALPQEIQAALEHPLAGVRAGAVTELVRLLGAKHGGVALAARLALEQLSDDDSREVSSRAAAAIAAIAPPMIVPAPAAPEPEPEPEPIPVPIAVATPVAMTTPAIVEVAPLEALPEPAATKPVAKPVAKPAAEPVAVPRQAAAPTAPTAKPTPDDPDESAERGRRRISAIAVLGWTSVALLLIDLAKGMVLPPFAILDEPYVNDSGPGLVPLWNWLLLPAMMTFLATDPGRRLRTVAEGAVIGLAAGLLGQLYVLNVANGEDWSDQYVLLALAAYAALGAVAVAPLKALTARGMRIAGIAATAVSGLVTLYSLIPHDYTSDVAPPAIAGVVLLMLLTAYLTLGFLRWRSGTALATVVTGAVVTGLFVIQMVIADETDPIVEPSCILIALFAVTAAILVPEVDRGRALAIRLGVVASLFAVGAVIERFQDSSEQGWARLTLLIAAALAVGTFLLAGRAARSEVTE